jgi:enoyl-CoA hydratase
VHVSDEVLVERAGGVMTITINRPRYRNAVNRAVTVAISSALAELDESSGLSVGIVTGAGGTFCSGMDLKAFLAGEDVTTPGRGFAGICGAASRKPLIAAVEGWALAGGCEIALACDLIVAADNARFGLPEVKRGLIAAGGGLLRLPRRVPAGIAAELLLTGDPMDAETAARFGLVNRVTAAGAALAGARELAARIAENGPLAVIASKEVLASALDAPIADGFAAQQPVMNRVFESADAREGALAFTEKRAPQWRGE